MDSALRARLAGMPQTPDEMLSAVSESLAARTGRSLEEWLALVRSSGVDPLDQAAVRGWLRREHGCRRTASGQSPTPRSCTCCG